MTWNEWGSFRADGMTPVVGVAADTAMGTRDEV